jgi:hypothetical protein
MILSRDRFLVIVTNRDTPVFHRPTTVQNHFLTVREKKENITISLILALKYCI